MEAKKERSTHNEMEILQLVIEEHPVLREKVLNKIRQIKSSFDTNPLEEFKKKQEDIKGKKRRAKKTSF